MKEMPEVMRLFLPTEDVGQPKERIEQVGTMFDGKPIYRYWFVGDAACHLGPLDGSLPPGFHIGVMAQEIEKVLPEAVVKIGGFLTVDYEKVTDHALKARSET